jgi:outer membrane protein TolC
MKKSANMNKIILVLLILSINQATGQVIDSTGKPSAHRIFKGARSDSFVINIRIIKLPPHEEEQLKEVLKLLVLKRSSLLQVNEGNITIAELARERAKTSWLSQVNLGANINEFVVSNTAAANFYPKYNLGISIPFDIISRSRYEKRVADVNIYINHALKEDQAMKLKTAVLIKYEEYFEKKELAILQRIAISEYAAAYESAQKMYSDGAIKLDDVNKIYQSLVLEQSKGVSREKDLNIVIIEIEQLIGIKLEEAIKMALDVQ